ncbi:unnamed protein product [Mytilus edulis]|uniref:Uncharacterized protein n=1 Tax=Mytilus edulis TaxID=6550 RepID=A0A8S3R141_MYTED|nr:unnamed protein product [Mytilus edulis]
MRSHGVGVEHIGPILKYILNLFNIEYSELPSCSSALLFDKEMNILAKEQMSEIFNENDNLTMHRDATTKSGRHFYAVELSNANTTYTLGLQELADGRAETYAKTTDDMISDINDVCTDNPNLNIMINTAAKHAGVPFYVLIPDLMTEAEVVDCSVRVDDLDRDIHKKYTVLEEKIHTAWDQYMGNVITTTHFLKVIAYSASRPTTN